MHSKVQLRDFIDVSSDVTAHSLLAAILSVIQSTGIDFGFATGKAMSGHLNGVQDIIMKSYPLALYTHCVNHCLNLA